MRNQFTSKANKVLRQCENNKILSKIIIWMTLRILIINIF